MLFQFLTKIALSRIYTVNLRVTLQPFVSDKTHHGNLRHPNLGVRCRLCHTRHLVSTGVRNSGQQRDHNLLHALSGKRLRQEKICKVHGGGQGDGLLRHSSVCNSLLLRAHGEEAAGECQRDAWRHAEWTEFGSSEC